MRAPLLPFALAAAIALAGGCRGKPSPPARTYTVRGEIVGLPAPGVSRPQLSLRHEAIPDFADEAGTVVGMPAMVMPFDLAPAVRTDALAPGDKIEAQVGVNWKPTSLRIESFRRLPPETPLRFH